MIGIDEQRQVDRFGSEIRIVSRCEYAFDIVDAFRGSSLLDDREHLWLDIDGVDFTLRPGQLRHGQTEITGTRADVGNAVTGFYPEVLE